MGREHVTASCNAQPLTSQAVDEVIRASDHSSMQDKEMPPVQLGPLPKHNPSSSRQACTHRITYKVTAHDHRDSRGAMVDRGANGGIIGSDARVILKHIRTVDVTGIDNHELNQLPIVDAAAKTITQHGPVIIILRQYAYHGTGRSIHSCIQFEYYKNRVDDVSIRAGGTQSIKTNDGYVIPLDIINGLPYMRMVPYTDTEWDKLPHVILTSSEEWNVTVLDSVITNRPGWYNLIKSDDNEDDELPNPLFDEDGQYRHKESIRYPDHDEEPPGHAVHSHERMQEDAQGYALRSATLSDEEDDGDNDVPGLEPRSTILSDEEIDDDDGVPALYGRSHPDYYHSSSSSSSGSSSHSTGDTYSLSSSDDDEPLGSLYNTSSTEEFKIQCIEICNLNTVLNSDAPTTDTTDAKDQSQDISDEDTLPADNSHILPVPRLNGLHTKPSRVDYSRYLPYFLNVPVEKIKKTFENTTQYATNVVSGVNFRHTLKSPYPANNVRRRNEPVATDTMQAGTPALNGGQTHLQFFVGRKSLVIDVYGMKSSREFVNTLEDVIRKRGAMDKLISDSAKVEISRRVKDILRALCIDDWQSERGYQHQNFAELRWGHFRRKHHWYMNLRNVPPEAWLLCAHWIADVMNHTSEKSLNWRTPLEVLTGQTTDISILLCFLFWDVVYVPRYKDKHYSGMIGSEKSSEIRGRFVGFSWDVGNALTFKILTDDTKKVICRSQVRLAVDGENNLKLEAEAGVIPQRIYLKSPTRR